MTTPDEARQARKAAMVQEAVDHIRVAGHVLMPMAVRTLERLYDVAEEDGRQRGVAQAGIALGGAVLPPRGEPYRHAILSELAKLAPGSTGLTLGELTTLVRTTGWDVSRVNVQNELGALMDAGLVSFRVRPNEEFRYLLARDGAR